MINKIKNIFVIPELKNRVLFTLGVLITVRLGAHIPIPGIDTEVLSAAFQNYQNTLLGLYNLFAGGAFEKATIFALGIMPYISASIVVQLLGVAMPYFQKLQKEGDSGRKKMTQITRYLTIVICMFQSTAYISGTIPPEAILVENKFLFTSCFFC